MQRYCIVCLQGAFFWGGGRGGFPGHPSKQLGLTVWLQVPITVDCPKICSKLNKKKLKENSINKVY